MDSQTARSFLKADGVGANNVMSCIRIHKSTNKHVIPIATYNGAGELDERII